MENEVIERILGVYLHLIEIKYNSQAAFARSMEMKPQNLSKVLSKMIKPQLDQVTLLINKHNINPYYIFDDQGPMFQEEGGGIIGNEIIKTKILNELDEIASNRKKIIEFVKTL